MSNTTDNRKVRRTIIEAARKRATEQRADYSIETIELVDGAYYVENIDTHASYIVNVNLHRCTCPAFKKDGFCKHYSMVQNDRREEAELTARAELLPTADDYADATEYTNY